MRHSFLLSLFVAGLLCTASVQAGEIIDTMGTPYFAFCRSNGAMGKTFYFSATQPIAAGVGRQALQTAFRDFLVKTYKYPSTGAVSCIFAPNGDLQGRTESTRQTTIGNLHASDFEVVETSWKFAK